MKTAKKAGKLLKKGYTHGLSDPFRALSQKRGDCVAASLVIKAVEDPIEELQIIRLTQKRLETNDVKTYSHFFCATGDKVIHLDGLIVEEGSRSFTRNALPARRHRNYLYDFYMDNVPLLNEANPSVTLCTELKGDETRSIRFAWVDPDVVLTRVAPDRSMDNLAELANAQLHRSSPIWYNKR